PNMESFIVLLSTRHRTGRGPDRSHVRWSLPESCGPQMRSIGSISKTSAEFLRTRLRSSTLLSGFADDIHQAMQGSGSAKIVGAALLRLDPSRTAQYHDTVGMDSVWFDPEGPSWQRAHWQVLAAAPFGTGVVAIPDLDLHVLRWNWFKPSDVTIQRCRESMDEVARNWRQCGIFDGTLKHDEVIVCSLPPVLAHMVAGGLIDSISSSLSRRSDHQLKPLRPLRKLRRTIVRPDGDQELVFNSAAFQALAHALGNVARDGISDDLEQRQETHDELERFRQWALRCSHTLSKQNMLAHRVEKGGKRARLCHLRVGAAGVDEHHGRFTSWFVLHSVLTCSQLLHDRDLNKVFKMAVRTFFPRELSKSLEEMVEGMPVPDASQLSRWRIMVDAAYMLKQRGMHLPLMECDCVVFMLSDSSPQGTREK
ncbi:unnamed protein product, partial [Prorocentrum cordatum]